MNALVMTGKRKTGDYEVVDVSRKYDSLNALLKDHIDAEVEDDNDIDTDKATPRCIAPTPIARSQSTLSKVHQKLVNEKTFKRHKSSDPLLTPEAITPKPNTRIPSNLPQKAQTAKSANDDLLKTTSFVDKSRFLNLKMVGSGSYGKVFKASDKKYGKNVAMKVIENLFLKREDSKRIYREIFLLKRLSNPYIIKLLDIIVPQTTSNYDKLCLVFDFVDTDLFRLVRSNQQLGLNYVQFIMYQLLQALTYLHSNKIIHRDLKPANVLIFANCRIKICDFGLARVIEEETIEEEISTLKVDLLEEQPVVDSDSTASETESTQKKLEKKLTKHVVTRWYRAPELILLLKYNAKIDIWSAGCILGELLQMESVPFLKRRPMFPGKSCFPLTADNEQVYKNKTDQLNQIFKVIGTPSLEDIEKVPSVKGYLLSLEKREPVQLQQMFPGIDETALDLLRLMLRFNPESRGTAEDGLMTAFFQNKRKFKVKSEKCSFDLRNCERNSSQLVSVEQYKRLITEEAMNQPK